MSWKVFSKPVSLLIPAVVFIITTVLPFLLNDAAAAKLAASTSVRTYAVVGDSGFSEKATAALRASLLGSQIEKLILAGDNLYNLKLSYEQVWGPWRAQGFQFTVPVIGNHTAGYAEEISYFGMPGEFYAKNDGEVLFLVLNSDNTSTVNAQAAWLRSELERASSKFVFVVYHHPPFTLSARHGWKEKQRFHELTRPILKEFSDRITAVIVGHDHIAGLYTLNDLPLIVSGSGVEAMPGVKVDVTEAGFQVKSQWLYKPARSWARIDVNEATGEVWVNFVDIKKDRVSCSVLISERPAIYRDNCAQFGVRFP